MTRTTKKSEPTGIASLDVPSPFPLPVPKVGGRTRVGTDVRFWERVGERGIGVEKISSPEQLLLGLEGSDEERIVVSGRVEGEREGEEGSIEGGGTLLSTMI